MAIYYMGNNVTNPIYNNVALDKIIYNGTTVYERLLYLFKSGGGGILSWEVDYSWPAEAEITSSYIHTLSDGSTGQCIAYSSNVDVTNYNYLCVDISQSLRNGSHPGHSIIGLRNSTSFNEKFDHSLYTFYNNIGRQTFKLNISNITGSYRVKFWSEHDSGAYGTHTYLYSIWLSK